jgi:hypothetical protein
MQEISSTTKKATFNQPPNTTHHPSLSSQKITYLLYTLVLPKEQVWNKF